MLHAVLTRNTNIESISRSRESVFTGNVSIQSKSRSGDMLVQFFVVFSSFLI